MLDLYESPYHIDKNVHLDRVDNYNGVNGADNHDLVNYRYQI